MYVTERKWSKPSNDFYTKIKRRRPGEQLLMIQQSYERSRSKRELDYPSGGLWAETTYTPKKTSPSPMRSNRYKEMTGKEMTGKEPVSGLLRKYLVGNLEGDESKGRIQKAMQNVL